MTRAPSFDILGSFFPAWLLCLLLGLLLTIAARVMLTRIRIELSLPVVTYPSLTAVFTLLLGLVCFR